MHHRLLVARLEVGEAGLAGQRGLEQRLPDARHVAVAEDPEAAGEQPLHGAVALRVLDRQEAHERLGGRQPHGRTPADVSGSRGSMSWPAQVSRIQACAGSSRKRQTRSSPGPAMTLR